MDFLAKSARIISSEAHPHHAQIVAKYASSVVDLGSFDS
jgi:hypothetical protein